MEEIIQIKGLEKVFQGGFQALTDINLSIRKGEIFALLGPNGAGKSTLINAVCGIVRPTKGEILIDGADIHKDYRKARSAIGLVPQELATDMFEKVQDTVNFSRTLFGKKKNASVTEKVLRDLALWEKKDSRIMALSGGMKRRLMIAKALIHEPSILFLDEPTAGVDVSLRKEMWDKVRELKSSGVTIILTTHYIEEAQEMADRIGIINNGKLILVEEKTALMKKLGKRKLILNLRKPPAVDMSDLPVDVSQDRLQLTYTFDVGNEEGISEIMRKLEERGIDYKDLRTEESSLEDIFVEIVRNQK
jgi:ABC-2 type transport system ATP-binding protein